MTPRSWSDVFTNGKSDRLDALVANAIMSRAALIQSLTDSRRDLFSECGHPRTLDVSQYQLLYDREAIAHRVVQVWPRECWQVSPLIYEREEADEETEFEKAWDELGKRLRGEKGWHKEERGSAVWEYLQRIDILSGIGQYGVLLLGLDDGADLSQEATPREGQGLMFLRCFPESLAVIDTFETNPSSPRYGQPVIYSLSVNDPSQAQGSLATTSLKVHWTRVIHIADNLDSSEVYGVPRMQPVLNRILDLQKLYGGSAEMYWRGAFPGGIFKTQPEWGDAIIDVEATRAKIEEWRNGLQRDILLRQMDADFPAPQVVDPTAQIEVQIQAICIKLGIPQRIFMGSERGQLASSQDAAAWNDRLKERQHGYITPRVIQPFVNRLIFLGVLPEPAEFCIHWPDLTSQTEDEKAKIFATRMQAWATYVGGSVESILTPMDAMTKEAGYTDEEATTFLDNAMEALAEREAEEAAAAAEAAELGETVGTGDEMAGTGEVEVGEDDVEETYAE